MGKPAGIVALTDVLSTTVVAVGAIRESPWVGMGRTRAGRTNMTLWPSRSSWRTALRVTAVLSRTSKYLCPMSTKG